VLPASAVCVGKGKKRPTLAFCISAEHLTGQDEAATGIVQDNMAGTGYRPPDREVSEFGAHGAVGAAGRPPRAWAFWHGRARTHAGGGGVAAAGRERERAKAGP